MEKAESRAEWMEKAESTVSGRSDRQTRWVESETCGRRRAGGGGGGVAGDDDRTAEVEGGVKSEWAKIGG